MRQIFAHELSDWLADANRVRPVLLDVRENWEYEFCHLPDSLPIPMNAVPDRIGELDPHAETVVVCHHGMRSQQVALYLEHSGFSAVHNLAGGIDAWSNAIDPSMRRY
ncbi:MAG: rhodanese-like domain-containing protein [Betaproteobacteria bacterium]